MLKYDHCVLNDLVCYLGWGVLGLVALGLLGSLVNPQTTSRALEQERARLRQFVLTGDSQGQVDTVRPQQGRWRDLLKLSEQLVSEDSTDTAERPDEAGSKDRPAGETPLDQTLHEGGNREFILLLIDYYAHGLTQARRNSMASLVSAVVGVGIVITGAVAALLSAQSGAGVTAAVVVSLSGAITNAIGVLFHRQANRALSHMEGQTQHLRQDMRTDRETRKAIELIEEVKDPDLRDRLRSAVILQLAQAELPGALTEIDADGGRVAGSGEVA